MTQLSQKTSPKPAPLYLLKGGLEAVREPPKAPSCHSEPFGRLRTGSAKNLVNLDTYAFEILRLTPQNDIVGQPLWGDLIISPLKSCRSNLLVTILFIIVKHNLYRKHSLLLQGCPLGGLQLPLPSCGSLLQWPKIPNSKPVFCFGHWILEFEICL